MQCVAVCCSVLQCVALCCRVWECVAVCVAVSCRLRGLTIMASRVHLFDVFDVLVVDIVSQCVAVWCSISQCVAVCCIVLQRGAVCGSVLPCVAVYMGLDHGLSLCLLLSLSCVQLHPLFPTPDNRFFFPSMNDVRFVQGSSNQEGYGV